MTSSGYCWEIREAYIERLAAAGKEHVCKKLVSHGNMERYRRIASVKPFPRCHILTSSNDGQRRPYAAGTIRQAHVCGCVVFVEQCRFR